MKMVKLIMKLTQVMEEESVTIMEEMVEMKVHTIEIAEIAEIVECMEEILDLILALQGQAETRHRSEPGL
jgi:hypothetical protein